MNRAKTRVKFPPKKNSTAESGHANSNGNIFTSIEFLVAWIPLLVDYFPWLFPSPR